jgi:hypothetical protein
MRCEYQYEVVIEDVAGWWLKSRPRQGGSRQRTSSRPMDDRAKEQHASPLAIFLYSTAQRRSRVVAVEPEGVGPCGRTFLSTSIILPLLRDNLQAAFGATIFRRG